MMFDYQSRSVYDDLQKFFLPINEKLRMLLVSNMLPSANWKEVEHALGGYFSHDFLECLKVGREQFTSDKLLIVLQILLDSLRAMHEKPICKITVATELSLAEKSDIEASINAKHGEHSYDYVQDRAIIGGIIYEIGSQCYDGSFKNVLFNIESEIKEGIS